MRIDKNIMSVIPLCVFIIAYCIMIAVAPKSPAGSWTYPVHPQRYTDNLVFVNPIYYHLVWGGIIISCVGIILEKILKRKQ